MHTKFTLCTGCLYNCRPESAALPMQIWKRWMTKSPLPAAYKSGGPSNAGSCSVALSCRSDCGAGPTHCRTARQRARSQCKPALLQPLCTIKLQSTLQERENQHDAKQLVSDPLPM